MSDLISRKAAIDAIHEDADWLAAQGSDWQVERMERDKSILMSLPSAEKAQLSEEGTTFDIPSAEPKTPSNGSITCMNTEKMHDRTMGDLISRQDAIKAVEEERFPVDSDYAEGFMAALDKVGWILKEWLPSAQKAQLSEEDATSDLISRKALLKQIDIDSDGERGYYGDNWKFIDTIEAMPSAEPERKTGKWIYYAPNGFQCSRCRRYLEISCGDVKMNFCLHCGSYNRGEQE